MSIPLQVLARCECGHLLEIDEEVEEMQYGIVIHIKACEKCLAKAREHGEAAGRITREENA